MTRRDRKLINFHGMRFIARPSHYCVSYPLYFCFLFLKQNKMLLASTYFHTSLWLYQKSCPQCVWPNSAASTTATSNGLNYFRVYMRFIIFRISTCLNLNPLYIASLYKQYRPANGIEFETIIYSN